MRKPLNPFGAVALALAVAALLQPAPLAAVDYEFDLTYDPAESVVAGTQVISFNRSEMADFAGGKAAVLALLNNAGAVPNPHENPLIEDLPATSRGSRPSYTRITSIVDSLGAAVPFEEFTPAAHAACSPIPCPTWPCGCGCRRATATGSPSRFGLACLPCARETSPVATACSCSASPGIRASTPDPDRFTLPPIAAYRVRIVVPLRGTG